MLGDGVLSVVVVSKGCVVKGPSGSVLARRSVSLIVVVDQQQTLIPGAPRGNTRAGAINRLWALHFISLSSTRLRHEIEDDFTLILARCNSGEINGNHLSRLFRCRC